MSTLEQLEPTTHKNVIDVVRDVGIDVSGWNIKKDGDIIEKASVNQSQIYRWSFGGKSEPCLLFIWYRHLKDENGEISFSDNLKNRMTGYANIKSGVVKGNKISASLRYERARQFEMMVRSLASSQLPCRVALLEPKQQNLDDDTKPSLVKFRELDSLNWYVHSFDEVTSDFKIIRNVKPILPIAIDDQFSYPIPIEKHPTSGEAYDRLKWVKEQVLLRSKGVCECCGQVGFQTANNTNYLEVHHVVPLSDDGKDEIWNTVAVCPNDHRKAHLGLDRQEILNKLLNLLAGYYPEYRNTLIQHATKVRWIKPPD